MGSLLRIHERDNVAVALSPIEAGECLSFGRQEGSCGSGQDQNVCPNAAQSVTAAEAIPQGHKTALTDIPAGAPVIKYGFPIGHATKDIPKGSWVHTHNMATNLEGEVEYTYDPEKAPAWDPAQVYAGEVPTFQGYLRPDGRAAIRNEIWIIPTVGCVNGVIKSLTEQNQDLVTGSIDGLYAFPHPFGCSQTGADHAQTRKLLAALVNHPNAGAVLVVGLGCENLTHDQFVKELGDYDPDRVKFMICQEEEDELAKGAALLKECAAYAGRFSRQSIPADKLVIGMKCGGSDGLSGITANPAVGAFSDMLCAQGGTTILTEVPEMFGAEGMLMCRCKDTEVFEKAVAMLNGFKQYFIRHGEVVYDNPSPGNKQGGITTLEDKSCGCVQKGGDAPVVDVLGYGDQVHTKGLNLLYGPGNDLVSSTALTAAGCHMVLFTTGRGTPFGAPAPTVKVATNQRLFHQKGNWMDFNAGTIAEGESVADAGKRLYELVLEVASGKKTCSEQKGYREISIFKDGIVL